MLVSFSKIVIRNSILLLFCVRIEDAYCMAFSGNSNDIVLEQVGCVHGLSRRCFGGQSDTDNVFSSIDFLLYDFGRFQDVECHRERVPPLVVEGAEGGDVDGEGVVDGEVFDISYREMGVVLVMTIEGTALARRHGVEAIHHKCHYNNNGRDECQCDDPTAIHDCMSIFWVSE